MKPVNCLRCDFRHKENGNCTAVGGFCTAVTAAHCPMLREYLDTGLTPAEVLSMQGEWCAMMSVLFQSTHPSRGATAKIHKFLCVLL